jgi:hypothetical protein
MRTEKQLDKKWNFKNASWIYFRSTLDNKTDELLELISQPHDIEALNSFIITSIHDAAIKSISLIDSH